jgi:hypothetical protein
MQTGSGRWRNDWQQAAAEFVGAVPFQHQGGLMAKGLQHWAFPA